MNDYLVHEDVDLRRTYKIKADSEDKAIETVKKIPDSERKPASLKELSSRYSVEVIVKKEVWMRCEVADFCQKAGCPHREKHIKDGLCDSPCWNNAVCRVTDPPEKKRGKKERGINVQEKTAA